LHRQRPLEPQAFCAPFSTHILHPALVIRVQITSVKANPVFEMHDPLQPQLIRQDERSMPLRWQHPASALDLAAPKSSEFLVKLGDQPRGLRALGFERSDVEALVEGTVPQKRVLMLAPGLSEELGEEREQLRGLFEGAMEY
ncbi:MAG: hypothetical protein Q9192_002836, partial [Flavoplaca navasiana]